MLALKKRLLKRSSRLVRRSRSTSPTMSSSGPPQPPPPSSSSGSSRRPGNLPARSYQMSAQEDVIAKKRAEIQAKFGNKTGTGSSASSGSSSSAAASASAAPYIGKPLQKKGINLKNRWSVRHIVVGVRSLFRICFSFRGFKGKKAEEVKPKEEGEPSLKQPKSEEHQHQHPSPSPPVKFQNDGSFLASFKKMQEKKAAATTTTAQQQPFLPAPSTSAGTHDSADSLSNDLNLTGVALQCVDPPQTKQEQNWFNEALKKARDIAQKARGGDAGEKNSTVNFGLFNV